MVPAGGPCRPDWNLTDGLNNSDLGQCKLETRPGGPQDTAVPCMLKKTLKGGFAPPALSTLSQFELLSVLGARPTDLTLTRDFFFVARASILQVLTLTREFFWVHNPFPCPPGGMAFSWLRATPGIATLFFALIEVGAPVAAGGGRDGDDHAVYCSLQKQKKLGHKSCPRGCMLRRQSKCSRPIM